MGRFGSTSKGENALLGSQALFTNIINVLNQCRTLLPSYFHNVTDLFYLAMLYRMKNERLIVEDRSKKPNKMSQPSKKVDKHETDKSLAMKDLCLKVDSFISKLSAKNSADETPYI